MANRNSIIDLLKSNRKIRNNMKLLNQGLDDLYQTTYSDPRSNKQDARDIRNNIDDYIDDIMTQTYTNNSVGKLTKLYTKLIEKKDSREKDILTGVEDAFADNPLTGNVISTWMDNKWIKDFDYEVDMVLKYMPKLREALSCKKDLVLSADHFSKDFLSYHNISSKGKEELFSKRLDELQCIYKLPQNYEKWYDDAQKYGEVFIYIAPYSREFEKMLRKKARNTFTTTPNESTAPILLETVEMPIESADISKDSEFAGIDLNECNITFTFNTSGILFSEADKITKMRAAEQKGMINRSLRETFYENVLSFREETEDDIIKKNKSVGSKTKIADKLVPDDLEFKDDEDPSSEMLIGTDTKSSESKEKITIPGCIVKQLDRSNVIPIYIEDVCLGYYYLEFNNNDITYDDPNSFEYAAGLNTMGMSGRFARNVDKMQQQNREKVIGYISKQLSDTIDAKFINNNQDLRNEIYHILKHSTLYNNPTNSVNGNITITFLSAEDVTHIYFNQDPVTKRGVSDLAYSMFPAKLYSCMYITEVLGHITRGQDKRVYYVKQNVESNISKTLLNVLNQVKKGNFGARQMENLGNILNITGRFNDYLIPMSPGGDPAIQFEVIPGQQFTDNSELMNRLERMAIDPTEVPYDLIEARQSLDYAIQATMSNSKLMRTVYKRQDHMEEFGTEITSKIYNYEYNENDRIEMTLPSPAFLNMTNGSQLVNGTIEYIQTLSNTYLADQPDEVKNEFNKIAIEYYIPTHVNINEIKRMITRAKLKVAEKSGNGEGEEE